MNKLHFLISLSIVLCLFSSCKDKIDVSNIDTRSELDLGLVLPIGSAHASFADLISTKTLGDSVFIDEQGVLTYRQSFQYKLDYHSIDWKEYTSEGKEEIFDFPEGSGRQSLTIPITLTLDKVNKDLSNERFDSIILAQAQLTSLFTKSGLSELSWDWIETITLHLGDQVYSPKGKDITIYTKGQQGDFGHTFTVDLSDYSLCLMKERHLPQDATLDDYNNNVVKTWSFNATVVINIPQGQSLSEGSLLYHYAFAINDFKAVWGFFRASNKLIVKDTIVMAEMLDLWKKIKQTRLPFERPSIHIDVNTSVSATVELAINEIFMQSNTTGEKQYALFNGQHQYQYPYDDLIGLDPATIGKRTTYSAVIDNSEEHGRLDTCFSIPIDICSYDFCVRPRDEEHHPQMRLVKDENPMDVNLTTFFPFSFKPGLQFLFTDTIRNINFTALALDSLLAKVEVIEEVKKADLNLYIHINNAIPLDVEGQFVFLDDKGQNLHIIDSSLVFKANDTTTYVVNVKESDFDRLATTKKIIIDVAGNDKTMRDKPELFPLQIKGNDGLTLFFGFAGNMDAVLNFNSIKK